MLLISFAACWYMVGLVAFVQAVAYPQFGRVGQDEFAIYHKAHTTLTTVAVLPPMFIELGTAIALLVADTHASWRWASLGLVLIAWLATFAVAVPAHERLKRGLDRTELPPVLRRLLIANAARGLAWLARGILLACVMPVALRR